MFLRVIDTRLGGYNKPVVANGIVKLDSKIPSTDENPNPNYMPPATQVFISPEESAVAAKANVETESDNLMKQGNSKDDNESSKLDDIRSSLIENSDEVAKKKGLDKTAKNIQKQIDKRNQVASDDKNVGTLEPVDMKAFITDRQHQEDTGNYCLNLVLIHLST